MVVLCWKKKITTENEKEKMEIAFRKDRNVECSPTHPPKKQKKQKKEGVGGEQFCKTGACTPARQEKGERRPLKRDY